MKKRDYIFLFLIALIFFSVLATIQKVPGYMDAEYYFGQSIRLAERKGLSEPFLWNYLNNPVSIPAPGFSFWLPLTSILASTGLWIFHSTSFFIARIPFILMATAIPLLAAYFANQFLPGRRTGWLAGGLAILSGYYLPFITITDTFTPFMVLGGLFFFLIFYFLKQKEKRSFRLGYLLAGLTIGLMSLTRSDGILWLIIGVLAIFLIHKREEKVTLRIIANFGILLTGFAIVLIPWFWRNFTIYHALFPLGNSLMLRLTSYSDLFVYPSSQLSFSHWFETGFSVILMDRIKALGQNQVTLMATGWGIVFLPFILIGFWKQRRQLAVQLAAIILIIIMLVMSFLFPYAGERGGFFHSLSSVQIIIWALIPVGLDVAIQLGVKHRNWKINRAWIMFGILTLLIAGGMSAFKMFEKVRQGMENGIPWNQSEENFTLIESQIASLNTNQHDVVMINDPPGYSLVTHQPSVMIPSGGTEAILTVCDRYQVGYMVLNAERLDVENLMKTDSQLNQHFNLIFEKADFQIYAYDQK
jgi:4-amino-4-deoxy-L-arabinose transferase-like glycosyltransferase